MTYPNRTDPKPTPAQRGHAERAEKLTGSRPGPHEQRAVTHQDAGQLGMTVLKAKYVSAAPTEAEYNALVDDVQAIAAVLNAMGARFTSL